MISKLEILLRKQLLEPKYFEFLSSEFRLHYNNLTWRDVSKRFDSGVSGARRFNNNSSWEIVTMTLPQIGQRNPPYRRLSPVSDQKDSQVSSYIIKQILGVVTTFQLKLKKLFHGAMRQRGLIAVCPERGGFT